ncbi:MAG TPA: FAD-dependent oxidoreductase, partial [Kiloniellales bacterium]|nr:FAD-dependent oxidoreductase [Kiloniellales bacterium]
PPLSKAVLSDGADPLVDRIGDEAFYRDNDIDLRLGTRIGSIDPDRRTVQPENGAAIPYDRLLLTTGARARTLPLPGAELDNVLTLRSATDARRLAPELAPGRSVVLVGGGFIGLEVAASARKHGCEVTVLEAAPRLLARMAGSEIADHVARVHAGQGVALHLSASVSAFEGRERVEAVRLGDDSRIPADLVVVGIGAQPNVELAAAAGLDCDDGILVDEHARTSAPDVLAAGDATSHMNAWLGRRLRLESWENAELQSTNAAKTICGDPEPYGGVPWFWTDQFDMNLQILGIDEPEARSLPRGKSESGAFCLFRIRDADDGVRIVAAYLINCGRDRRPVKRLIESRRTVEAAALADPDRPLRELAAARGAER